MPSERALWHGCAKRLGFSMNENSICLIVPSASRDNANRLMLALFPQDIARGSTLAETLPGNFFSVPLSNNGTSITHYGARMWANDGMIADLRARILGGIVWADYGLTGASALAAWNAIERDGARNVGDDLKGHFLDLLRTRGLRKVLPAHRGSPAEYGAVPTDDAARAARLATKRADYAAANP